ncbi:MULTISPECIES: CsbD family protein [Nocardiopsis]|uniref:CsbD family protein n=1 Tax=Nocardiopsis TaxID=2013 RepID=UPI0003462152|nr:MULTISPECIES: CsbD family protein [Nocardiopsis]MBQ1084205.1 CsbD family protein [Nocardiopsis sp. B62]PWV58275.1 CsbD-like protein [Nocardiopsis sp. L17-MgMaSL7]
MGKHFDDAAGKGKEAFGKATGDKRTEAEGKLDQTKAGAKDKADKAKDKAEDLKDKAEDKIKGVFKKK